MKLVLAQCNFTIGDVDGNVAKIMQCCRSAYEQRADLIVFSELSICGYPPKDLLNRPAFIDCCLDALEDLRAFSETVPDIGILIGLPMPSDSQFGAGLVNAAVLLEGGHRLLTHHKWLLPNYDVFDESRYFESGRKLKTIPYKGRKIGITICEDAWAENLVLGRSHYYQNPIDKLCNKGADLIINLSASPYYISKPETREALFAQIATDYEVDIALVNQVGGIDGLVFDGNSLAINAAGEPIKMGKSFDEDLMIVDFEQKTTPQLQSKTEQWQAAISLGIRDYVHKSGFQDVVIGLSGGIDSALVAALAVRALGPEHVLGVAMPGPYSFDHSLTDAKQLAKNLGIECLIEDVNPIYVAYNASMTTLPNDINLTKENLQARIRGTVLMAISNEQNRMVLTTGNKSEIAVGYCTLYGDMNGALNPIGDLYKTQVIELAKTITAIPESIITKPPSAELRPNQTDQDSLPDYETLDAILTGYIEAFCDQDQLIANGYDPALVDKIIQLVKRSEYKRFQAPPIIKLTPKAFGEGRRHVLTAQ